MGYEQSNLSNLYDKSKIKNQATNTWLTSDILSDSMKNHKARGKEQNTNYNLFASIFGVEDKVEYYKELFYWKAKLETQGKKVLLLEGIPSPTVEEVNRIQPGNYVNINQLVSDLSRKIKCPYPKLLNQATKAFIDTMIDENENTNEIFGKMRVKAISLLSWFSRYGRLIFSEDETHLPVVIYYGSCENYTEALFLKFLASLPADVILINPNLEAPSVLKDSRLFEKKFSESMELRKFPQDINDVNHGTAAYFAEQDLETLLYQDSGLFKDRQFKDAVTVALKTMYEELYILWDQENKMRPNFEIIGDKVVIPTIIAKVCGVKDSDVTQYWKDVSKLIDEDTMVMTSINFYNKETENFDTEFAIKNGELKKANIVNNRNYQYGIYREKVQEYMLNKLEFLLESRLIRGTFTDGVEHTIIKVIMNLDKKIVRLIQNIDFTKKNPKIVLVNNGENEYPLEESIILAYLHLIGFDIVLFAPTGYRIIEKYYTKSIFIEHQIGEYMFELNVPSYIKGKKFGQTINNNSKNNQGFFKKLLGR